jgi:hypothetical protein
MEWEFPFFSQYLRRRSLKTSSSSFEPSASHGKEVGRVYIVGWQMGYADGEADPVVEGWMLPLRGGRGRRAGGGRKRGVREGKGSVCSGRGSERPGQNPICRDIEPTPTMAG